MKSIFYKFIPASVQRYYVLYYIEDINHVSFRRGENNAG